MDLSNAENSSVFNFATEQARTIVYLHLIDLAICLAIALTVTGLLVYVIFKFRSRAGDTEPRQNVGNVKLEITWTLIPALIVLGLGIGTASVMHKVNPPLSVDRKPDVIVRAHQWWWEYRYPKSGVVTANELYLPEGIDSLLAIESADVIHSFWVPDFGQKMDAIPGHEGHLLFTPIRKGLFRGSCSEFCGADHSLMGILVKVVSPADFEIWTKNQLHVPVTADNDTARSGEKLFLAKTCIQCHTIAGTRANGQIGPDLTHLSTRQTIGSALLPNTEENVSQWITNPQQFKPGCHMPKMRLSKSEAHDISVYLETLK